MLHHALSRAVALLSVMVVALAVLGAPVSTPEPPGAAAVETAAAVKLGRWERGAPNVVMVMADDMTTSDLRYMPRTQRLLGSRGTRFTDAVSANPMCCPARAAFLTGQESQNNGVRSNGGPQGGYQALVPGLRLPSWLRSAGYFTAFTGKHLNGYRPDKGTPEEPGWTYQDPILRGLYNYLTYNTWNNGKPRKVREYVTTYLTDRARTLVRRFDKVKDRRPFFMWVGNVAPHNAKVRSCNCYRDPIPAERDRGDMRGTRSPSRESPAYDHRNRADKPPFMRHLDPIDRREVDRTFQRRVEALTSVDRQVKSLVETLRRQGELKRTVIAFTSDNGYMLGEHRYVGKRLPYEASLGVPLLVRGPGVARGSTTPRPTSTVDLTATIVDLAGATPTHPLDGVSLVPGLRNPDAPLTRMAELTQTGASADREGDMAAPGVDTNLDGWLHRGYRDSRYTYSHWPARGSWSAHDELYDRERDPAELHNLVDDPAYAEVLKEARRRAEQLHQCVGDGCHPDWAPLPGPS